MKDTIFIIPARRSGKTLARDTAIDQAMLATLFDADGELSFAHLQARLPITRRELFRALDRQYRMGNICRHLHGDPVRLTSSARCAIGAGRGHDPVLHLSADKIDPAELSAHLSRPWAGRHPLLKMEPAL